MISTSPDDLMIEIRAAEELRKRIISNTTTLVRRYAGNWYRSDQRGKPRPENMLFNFVATLVPQLVFSNPGVKCSAKRSITHKAIAQWIEMGMNGWIQEVQLRTELEALAMDFLFCFACCKVGLEDRGFYQTDEATATGVEGRFTMEPMLPFMVRVPPANVIIDSKTTNGINTARIIGEMFQRDLSDLKEDPDVDPTCIEWLTADEEKSLGKSSQERPFHSVDASEPMRGKVTLYQIYLPEYRQIGTLALNSNSAAKWVKPLTKYHGPKTGPYTFFGVYLVPDQVYPLSPIAAMAQQDEELNAHAAAAASEAASAKNLILVDANQPELARTIEEAPKNSVIKVKGLNGQNVLPVSIGGTTEQRLTYLNLLLQRTDRNSGQSEAARGKAQGVTATEAHIADSSKDAREAFLEMKYTDGVKQALGNVGWYLFHDPAVVLPVSFEDPQTGQPSEGLYLGGVQPGQEDVDYTGFFLDIEPYSMGRINPQTQQQQAQLVLAVATQIAPLMPQFPYINWPAILDMIGEANNITDFAKIVLNMQGLAMMQAGMPGQLTGGNPLAAQGLPPGTNPNLVAGMQGAPVAGMMQPPAMAPGAGGGGAGGGMPGAGPGAVSPFLQKLVAGAAAKQIGGSLPVGGL